MLIILQSVWRDICKEAIKAFAITAATAIATKGIEYTYETHFKKNEVGSPSVSEKKRKKNKKKKHKK